jgi:hypothetical protein
MRKMTKNNTFISTKHRMGPNTGNLVGTPDESFGRMKYFFRTDFTSGMQNYPTVFVDWAQFRCISRCRTSSTGRMLMEHWEKGPHYTPDCQPFLSLSQVKPSRYALAYGPTITSAGVTRRQHKQVSFLALDSERLGLNVEDNMTQDFGDNCLNFYLPDKRMVSQDEEEGDAAEDDEEGDAAEDDEESDAPEDDEEGDAAEDEEEEVVVAGGGGGGGDSRVVDDFMATLFSPSVLRYLQYK